MQGNIKIKFLGPDEYYLIDHFFDEEKVPRLDPNFSKVVAAIDTAKGRVVGIMCLQLVAHAEPIIIDAEYRQQGVWWDMAQMMNGYVSSMGLPGLYTQPTHDAARHMCEKIGFVEVEHPLYVKIYDNRFDGLVPEGG